MINDAMNDIMREYGFMRNTTYPIMNFARKSPLNLAFKGIFVLKPNPGPLGTTIVNKISRKEVTALAWLCVLDADCNEGYNNQEGACQYLRCGRLPKEVVTDDRDRNGETETDCHH
jgi:hypothetical protein